MDVRPPRRFRGWPLLLLLCMAVVPGMPGKSQAAQMLLRQQNGVDRLTIIFDSPPELYNMLRDTRTSLKISLPSGWMGEQGQPPGLMTPDSELVKDITPDNGGVTIELRTPAFGYVHQLRGDRLTIDIFPDPLGERWEPNGEPERGVATAGDPLSPIPDANGTAKASQEPAQEVGQQDATASASQGGVEAQAALEPGKPAEQPAQQSGQQSAQAGPLSQAASSAAPLPSQAETETPTPSQNVLTGRVVRPAPSSQPQESTADPEPARTPPPGANRTAAQQQPLPAASAALVRAENRTVAASPAQGPEVPVLLPPAEDNEPGEAVPTTFPGATAIPAPEDNASGQALQAPGETPAAQPPPSWGLRSRVVQRGWGDPNPLANRDRPGSGEPVAPAQVADQLQGQSETQLEANATAEATSATSGQESTAADDGTGQLPAPAPPPLDRTPPGSTSGDGEVNELVRKAREPRQTSGPIQDNLLLTPEQALAALKPPIKQEGQDDQEVIDFVPDFPSVIQSARAAMVNENYEGAISVLDAMRVHPKLPKDLIEEVLYTLADAHFAQAKEDYRTHYDTLSSLYTAAMNQDPNSERAPEALLKLGLINLRVGNQPEAEAYFNILLRDHPNHPNIPLVYFYQGKNFFDNGQFQEAADKYQFIVQEYPDSRFVREASVGLAEALSKLGYNEQAMQIIDYIEKRWPRFYVQYPPILRLGGDIASSVKEWERARTNYWTYYNLDPTSEDGPLIMARLGDVYLGQGSPEAARETWEETAKRHPGTDGGLISLMRLAENGVHDAPSVQEMFGVFDKPFSTEPADIYESILAEHPQSGLAPLARLKLGMWRLFNGLELEALDDVETFLTDYPDHQLTPQALEVAGQAFQRIIANQAGQENYQGMLTVYTNHPMIAKMLHELPPATQTAMALAFWKTGRPAEALEIAERLLERPGMPEESEMALHLATTIYLESQAWDKIAGLNETVEEWELSQRAKDEFDYALALAYENLQSPEKSQALWEELVDKDDLGVNRIAYTKYFLAMEARKREDLKTAYDNGMDALSYFLESGEDPQKVMDLLQMLMDVADVAGRPRDALKWAIEYGKRLDPADARWPAMRYRTAQLYKKVQDQDQWRAILEELSTQLPNTQFGRMAAMDLKTQQLEDGVSQYTPPPPL